MWFFDWFVTYFEDTRSYFQSTADAIGGVPYVGASLASPFYYIASFFANLRTASQYASSWSDTVYTNASAVFAAIQATLQTTYPILAKSPFDFFSWIQGYITSAYWILTASASGVVNWLYNVLVSNFAVLSASGSWFFGQVRSYIESTYGILTMSGSSFASWLLPYLQALGVGYSLGIDAIWSAITGGRIQAWITDWFNGMSATVLTFVTNSWGYLITSAFSFLGSNWSSFESSFGWLSLKIIDLMIRQVTSFAGALWSLIEAVLKNIQLPER